MTSVDAATTPPDFTGEAVALLSEIDAQTARLSRSETIPHELEILVKELGDRLHAVNPVHGLASVAPDVRTELWAAAWLCRDAVDAHSRRDLRVHLEHVRHLLRDVVDEHPASPDRDPREIARWVAEVVAVPQAELADVLGVAPRTLQRWLSTKDHASPAGDELARLLVVASVVAQLRHSFTGPGTLRWFSWSNPQLDGRRPADLLSDVSAYPRLRAIACRARSMVAT